MRTAEEWLKLHAEDKDKCAVEVTAAIYGRRYAETYAPVDLGDWNGAIKAWRDNSEGSLTAITKVFIASRSDVMSMRWWSFRESQPYHYWLAAAMAAERADDASQ